MELEKVVNYFKFLKFEKNHIIFVESNSRYLVGNTSNRIIFYILVLRIHDNIISVYRRKPKLLSSKILKYLNISVTF